MYVILDKLMFQVVDTPEFATMQEAQAVASRLEIEHGLDTGRLMAIEEA